jgi:four helix bundle protein
MTAMTKTKTKTKTKANTTNANTNTNTTKTTNTTNANASANANANTNTNTNTNNTNTNTHTTNTKTAKRRSRTRFRVYEDALRLVRLMRPLWEQVAKHDRNLGKQMRDAATSVPGNVAEGMYRFGGHQRERFGTAMGSARECIAHLETSVAAGYLGEAACEEAMDCADKVAATLWRCIHR